jgi:large subunit ribosomal protein L22
MGKQANTRRTAANEARAVTRSIRTSPQKLNLVAEFIRGMNASDAVTQLTFLNKKVALDVRKTLESAIANAENNHNLDVDRLYVVEATVGKGIVMKRWRARARGRAARILKPFSNLYITVREREENV